MKPLAPSTLALVALVAAVASFVLVGRYFGALPTMWPAAVSMVVVAAICAGVARWVRRAVADGRIGQDRSQLHPVTVARALALGQSAAVLGALVGGIGAGLTAYLALNAGQLTAAREELPAGIAVLVGGIAAAAAGLWLERACTGPDEAGGDEPGAQPA